MSAVVLLKFLHIAMMFTAVGVATGTEVMAHRVASSGDVRGIRTFFSQARPIAKAIPVLYLSGVALGLLAAWQGALNLFAPWLVIAYVLFALTLALHATVGAGWFRRMDSLAAASPDNAASPELAAAADELSARLLLWYTLGIIVVFVYLMVAKPLS